MPTVILLCAFEENLSRTIHLSIEYFSSNYYAYWNLHLRRKFLTSSAKDMKILFWFSMEAMITTESFVCESASIVTDIIIILCQ